MGQGLFESFPEMMDTANRRLGYSVANLCLEGPASRLNETQYTQPLLYVVNCLSYLKRVRETGRTPDYMIGHSLGEYSALFAAGIFDFETGLQLVQKRGELMASATGGGMAAVIGFDGVRVRDILRQNCLHRIEIANFNSPVQTVVSGLKTDITAAQPVFEAAGARAYIPLSVSGAFHSRYMMSAAAEFKVHVEAARFQAPRIPVISNVEGIPYTEARAKQLLCEQIIRPVNWMGGMQYLFEKGITTFEEMGPGTVLTALKQQIGNSYRVATAS